jgi:hypothetical protein
VRAGQEPPVAPGPVVLFLDQFEEAITTDPEGARELLSLVVSLAGDTGLRVVLTLRWESLGSLLTPELAATFEDSTVFVTAMSRHALREAIVRPAEYAPGLHFEDGLVERILDDAGSEPGRLPLVESLLTELWRGRRGGSLTLAGYEAVGGVNGALVQLAERAVVDHGAVRRLLTLLARPVGDDFVRRPVALERLDPELFQTAQRLAADRLVVIGSAPDGTATVELAHQALIEHWPRLREWLIEDRDFLSWLHQVEIHYQQWKAAAQDPGALLRGTVLAASLEWTRTRAGDVPPEAHGCVRLSHRRQRRDVRRWRLVTAMPATSSATTPPPNRPQTRSSRCSNTPGTTPARTPEPRGPVPPWAFVDDGLLDRIDEIVPPGTDVGPVDVAYAPQHIDHAKLRRRAPDDRAARRETPPPSPCLRQWIPRLSRSSCCPVRVGRIVTVNFRVASDDTAPRPVPLDGAPM